MEKDNDAGKLHLLEDIIEQLEISAEELQELVFRLIRGQQHEDYERRRQESM